MTGLQGITGDVRAALEAVSVPSYAIDATGVIRWLNPAAERLVGDVRGRQFTSVVAAEDTRRAREHFVRKLVGTEKVTDARAVLVDAEGRRVGVEISSVPLMEGDRIVGVFGQLPGQVEVLSMLQRGASTDQIARELHLSTETVRNHVRGILRALGVHTRLEAVAMVRQGPSDAIAARP